MSVTVRVIFNRMDTIGDKLAKGAADVVAKTSLDLEARVKRAIQEHGLIDTGAMLNSVQAHQLGPLRWVLEVGQSYAIYHVFGKRHLPARDFWNPPIDAARVPFAAAMRQVLA